MDRYTTFGDCAAGKLRIFRNQELGDVAITNAANHQGPERGARASQWRFSSSQPVGEGAFLDGDTLVLRLRGEEHRVPRSVLRLEGRAHVENALTAWLASRPL